MNAEHITAVRTYKGDRATITVTLPDGTTRTMGGARAARATAVLVDADHRVSCRADLAAATTEAHRLSTATTRRSSYSWEPVPCTPIATVAVAVTEADAAAAAAAPEVVSAGALQAGDVIQLRKGGVLCTWEDQPTEGVSWDDLEKVPTGVDLTVEAVEPVALRGYRSPHGRRSRAYVVTVGGRPFKVSSSQRLLRRPAPAVEPAPAYVHPGRAYCDQPHPGDDAQADRYCRDYHRPWGPGGPRP